LQKYAIYNAWFSEFIAWLESRNAGKSTKLAIYTMLRSLLIPFHATYFLGNTGEQAKETFKKIEKLAKKEIESFAGSTLSFLKYSSMSWLEMVLQAMGLFITLRLLYVNYLMEPILIRLILT
jgi:hypothetical protein